MSSTSSRRWPILLILYFFTTSIPVDGKWCYTCDTNTDPKCTDPVQFFSTKSKVLLDYLNNTQQRADQTKVLAFSPSSYLYVNPADNKTHLKLAETGAKDDYCTSKPKVLQPDSSFQEVCRYDPGPLRLVDCDAFLLDAKMIEAKKTTMCLKIVQSVTMEKKAVMQNVIRQCAVKPDNFNMSCVEQISWDGHVKVNHCACEDKDACNQAVASTISLFSLLYAVFFACLVKF